MKQKYYFGIGIIVLLIIIAIFAIQYFTPSTGGGVEVKALKSFEAVSDVQNPSVLNDEEIEFEIEILPIKNPDHIFRLFLPESVQYVSGDFILKNGELILEPSGQLGVNLKGEYLGEDAEEWIMKLDKTRYSFKVKGISKDKHTLVVETGSKDKIDKIKPSQWGSISEFFVELRSATFCSADTLEEATQLCLKSETECIDEECIRERLKSQTERIN